jgi:hypothetical protein
MSTNVEQHKAFTPGFNAFDQYVRTCGGDYDGARLKTLIDAFAEPLVQHLHDEIGTLRALSKYDSEQVRQAYRRMEKRLMATDNVRLAP